MSKEFSTDGLRVAILVDGQFFLKRYSALYNVKRLYSEDPEKIATGLYDVCTAHAKGHYLYRLLYYDCYPSDQKGVHNPISKKTINFANTDVYGFKTAFYNALVKKRKVALRLGYLKNSTASWAFHQKITKCLLNGTKNIADLKEDDVYYQFKQKGVDMKMGLDIASIAYKKLVDQIVLVSGDTDFVSAAKLARREGIDFILDPMWNRIDPSLQEHIDGLTTYSKRK